MNTDDQYFSKLAKVKGFLNEEEFEEIQDVFRSVDSEDQRHTSIADICLENNFLTKEQVQSLRKTQTYLKSRVEALLFGDIAVERELLTQEQLDRALEQQERAYVNNKNIRRLKEILQELPVMSQDQIEGIEEEQEKRSDRSRDAEIRSQVMHELPGLSGSSGSRSKVKTDSEEGSYQMTGDTSEAGTSPEVEHQHLTLEHSVREVSEEEEEDNANGEPVHVIDVKGVLDVETYDAFEEMADSLVNQGASSRFVLNFSDLERISSAGIGVVFSLARTCRDRGGDLRIADSSEEIQEIFDIIGGLKYIRFYNSTADAVRSFVLY